jgi:uncharacterized protein
MSQECEATADAFFAHLQKSVQGWKAATVAQGRIVGAIETILSQADDVDMVIIGHGGTDAFLSSSRRTTNRSGAMLSRQRTVETDSP